MIERHDGPRLTTDNDAERVKIRRHPPDYRAPGIIASKKVIITMTNRTVRQSDGGNHRPIISEGESHLHRLF